jgi:copper chaperone CopZ
MAVKNITVDIGGMSCDGCVRSVRSALTRLSGVSQVEVAIGTAKFTLEDSASTEDDVIRALDRAGFHPSALTAH